MKLAIFARTFGTDDLPSLHSKLKAAGIADIHYNMSCSGLPSLPQDIPETYIDEVTYHLVENGIQLVGLSATYNMIHPDPGNVSEGNMAFEALSLAAAKLQIPILSLCTGTRDPQDKWTWHPQNSSRKAWKDLLIQMENTLATAETHDIWLAIEPEHGNIIKDAKTASTLIKEIKNPRLKVILDPANLFETARDDQEVRDIISEAMDLLHEQIGMAHAKDRRLDGRFVPAGKGAIDFEYFIDLLTQSGFRGHLVMHGLEESEIPEAKDYLDQLLAGNES